MTKELIRAMMKAGRDPYDELRRVMRERDDARAILSDLLTERGESWLAQLVGRREAIETFCRYHEFGSTNDEACSECGEFRAHDTQCELAAVLRAVGGELERQRQVDAAHAAAVAHFDGFRDIGLGMRYPAAMLRAPNRIEAIQQSFNAAARMSALEQLATHITPSQAVRIINGEANDEI